MVLYFFVGVIIGPPTNVSATGLSYTTILVEWDPIQQSLPGYVLGYQVFYTAENSNASSSVIVNRYYSSVTLTNLIPQTWYDITVEAFSANPSMSSPRVLQRPVSLGKYGATEI